MSAEEPPQPPAPPIGDVLLFSDLVGSTDMSHAPAVERFAEAMSRYHAFAEQTIRSAGGEPARGDGDCWTGHFDDPRKALKAAEELQRGLPALAWRDGDERERTFHVRIALHHAGEIVHREPGRALESYPHYAYAKRVKDQTTAGQILASNTFHERLARYAVRKGEWRACRPTSLKDQPGPQFLHERLWDGGSRGEPGSFWLPSWLRRYAIQFIGRQTYLDEIEAWLNGSKPCLILHGFGGIGKTRLAAQALTSVSDRFRENLFAVSVASISLKPNPDNPGAVSDESLRELADAVARAILGETVQFTDPTRELLARLRSGGKPCLLLIDNWESVHHPDTVHWLSGLLREARSLRCLVTSRTLFQMGGPSRSIELGGMEIPETSGRSLEEQDGYRLFKAVVEQQQPAKPIDDPADREALVQILNDTMGFAFAIEL